MPTCRRIVERILTDGFQVPSELARLARSELETLAEVVVPDDVPVVSRDPDDDQVLAAALAAEAEVDGNAVPREEYLRLYEQARRSPASEG